MAAEEFASEEDLLDRLSARPHDLVYLVGSAVTASNRVEEPGVPRVDGVIELIRDEYRLARELVRLDSELSSEPDNRYQAAFRFVLRTRDQDVANRVIQRAVLLARRPSPRFPTVPTVVMNYEHGRSLEDDIEGWHLPPAVAALGQVLAQTPVSARPMVLTSNFDPLVAISVRRAGGRAYSVALHGDGNVLGVDGHGCLVVQFHGDWFRTDTLHVPAQLGQERPKLSASLAHLIRTRTVVVLGYSGWDDVFTRSLIAMIRGGLAPLKIAWAFRSADETAIVRGSSRLLDSLRPGIELGRVALYKGIDVHAFLPKLATRLMEQAEPTNERAQSAPPMVGSRAQPRGDLRANEAVVPPLLSPVEATPSSVDVALLNKPVWATAIGRDNHGLWVNVTVRGVSFRLRWMPPGRFLMGSPNNEQGRHNDESPQHEVVISRAFWLGETLVTQELWMAVMDANPSHFQDSMRPVEQVSWNDAQSFIARISEKVRQEDGLCFRLPTEAEWEYACRAGTTTATYAGAIAIQGENNAPILDQIAWYRGNSGVDYDLDEGVDSSNWPEKQHVHTRAGTRRVKQKLPNPWGLYDMLGNVWEWCIDAWDRYEATSSALPDPVKTSNPAALRVCRGGGWYAPARLVRAGCRNAFSPDFCFDALGLRLVRGLPEGPSSR